MRNILFRLNPGNPWFVLLALVVLCSFSNPRADPVDLVIVEPTSIQRHARSYTPLDTPDQDALVRLVPHHHRKTPVHQIVIGGQLQGALMAAIVVTSRKAARLAEKGFDVPSITYV